MLTDKEPPRKLEAGNDYTDDPIESGGLDNEASRRLMDKFSKFKPTRAKDGGRKLHSHRQQLIVFFSSGLMSDCSRCVAHEAGPEARRGEGLQDSCPSRRLFIEEVGLSEDDWCGVY